MTWTLPERFIESYWSHVEESKMVTWRALALTSLLSAGILLVAGGMLFGAAAGMSDNPSESNSTRRRANLCIVVGICVVTITTIALVR